MLTALRRFAGTWFAKVLFVLLILSFAVWGIGDMVQSFGRDDAVARVSGRAITIEEAQAGFRREMQRLMRQMPPDFQPEEGVRLALVRQSLERLILTRVVQIEAERLGIVAPDAAVRDVVFGLEALRGLDGRFSRAAFDALLRNNNVTEAEFLEVVRADLLRQQLVDAVRAGAAAPDALVTPLLRWQLEQREATLVTLPIAAAPEPAAPAEAALRRFHENNPERFSSPEYRGATVAVMTAERLSREVEVAESELAAGYEQRAARYQVPERRQLEQVVMQQQESAREISLLWRGGADFESVTAAAEVAGGQAVELGLLDRSGLPFLELAAAAFSLAEGAVSEPVPSPFGWHVLRVARIAPPETRTLAQVREELRREIAGEKTADIAFERANQIEDALAGGATLAEVAQRFNLGFAAIRTDATGRDPEGRPVDLPVIEAAREPLLAAIFATRRGAAPRLRETEAGFVAIDVTAIEEPRLRAFETVEAEVRAAWLDDARRRAQEERAAALLGAVREGRTLAAAAAEAGLASREVAGVRRDARQGGLLPPEMLAPLFELKDAEATMVPTRDGFAVAQLRQVVEADPDGDPTALRALRAETEQALALDLEVQYLATLRARSDVRVNQRLLEQIARP
jgi:peptidyl-prolyl cis-trans isomerase D